MVLRLCGYLVYCVYLQDSKVYVVIIDMIIYLFVYMWTQDGSISWDIICRITRRYDLRLRFREPFY